MSSETLTATNALPPRYWKSPEAFQGLDPEQAWTDREFPEGATVTTEQDRRTFLKLMGASIGLAGVGLGSGCRWPEKRILAYSKQPEQIIPGVPLFYATSMPGAVANLPLLVETHQARPTKVEGNPSYVASGGATSTFAQASVLDLYDPDRLQRSARSGVGALTTTQTQDLLRSLYQTYRTTQGRGLALLIEPSTSPTRERLLRQLKTALPQAVVAAFTPTEPGTIEAAHVSLLGRPSRPRYHLAAAKRILALDSDFLATEPGHLDHARAFAAARKVAETEDAKKMARLYAAESNFTLTGAMADHRLRLASSHVAGFASLILAEALSQTGQLPDAANQLRQKAAAIRGNVDVRWVRECVTDLLAHRGQAVVVAGPHLPAAVHQLVFALNSLLEAHGKTVSYPELPSSGASELAVLVAALQRSEVDTLVVIGGNPVYDAPADLQFAKAIKNAGQIIRLGYHPDETANVADIVLAQSHYLESWSDGRAWDGTYVPVQPMISPLFTTLSEIEVLELLSTGTIGGDTGYGSVRATFQALTGQTSDLVFDSWLAEGVLPNSAYPTIAQLPSTAEAVAIALAAPLQLPALSESSLELRFVPSPHAFDGRYNNNGWLMECPDPMTKLTWDNAILVSPKMAKSLGIDPGTNKNLFERGRGLAYQGKVAIGSRSVVGPLHIQPGLSDFTVILHLGFGRQHTGRIGSRLHHPDKGQGIGFDVYPLIRSEALTIATGAKIEVLPGEPVLLANTQEHWSMEGRAIIRESNADYYAKNPDFVDQMGVESHSPPIYGAQKDASVQEKALTTPRGGSLYDPPVISAAPPNVGVWNTPEGQAAYLPPQQWGMSIDLNSCLGCNACVIACQSENNIPIVGKDQVSRGREMHWIRLDRYYTAGPDADPNSIPEDPQVSFMGLACVHCELAPCEQVCPVNATVHDNEGLNVMAYNRCVGTRYCANNCPYKVRRFNFFDYNKRTRADLYKGPLGQNYYETKDSQLTRMGVNPDVTVRMRGVMEKCTYCVQRIQEGKIHHKVAAAKAGRPADTHVPDGIIKTACQQTCPTDAISFGDISDETSEVSKRKAWNRDYSLLGYLNVRPRTTYLARLRNPNPAMPDYQKQPLSYLAYKAKGHGGDAGHGGGDSVNHHHEGAHH